MKILPVALATAILIPITGCTVFYDSPVNNGPVPSNSDKQQILACQSTISNAAETFTVVARKTLDNCSQTILRELINQDNGQSQLITAANIAKVAKLPTCKTITPKINAAADLAFNSIYQACKPVEDYVLGTTYDALNIQKNMGSHLSASGLSQGAMDTSEMACTTVAVQLAGNVAIASVLSPRFAETYKALNAADIISTRDMDGFLFNDEGHFDLPLVEAHLKGLCTSKPGSRGRDHHTEIKAEVEAEKALHAPK